MRVVLIYNTNKTNANAFKKLRLTVRIKVTKKIKEIQDTSEYKQIHNTHMQTIQNGVTKKCII